MNLMTSFFPKRVDHEAGGNRSRRFFFAALISISFLSEKDRWNTPIPMHIDRCTGVFYYSSRVRIDELMYYF